MAKTNNLTDFLTDLADGIRTAEGSTGAINPQNFRSRIEGLVATVTDDATAGASNILSGKTAYVKGSKVTGNIATISTVSNSSYQIDKVTQSGPIVSVSATSTQVGYLDGSTSIVAHSPLSNFGNATAADVVAGTTFTSSAGLKVTGTLDTDSYYDSGYDTGYGEGYDEGYADGQTHGLEALGVLCEWTATVSSEGFMCVSIINNHPSYYLRCTVTEWYDDTSNVIESEDMIIAPNSVGDYSNDTYVPNYDGVALVAEVTNIRWTANGT